MEGGAGTQGEGGAARCGGDSIPAPGKHALGPSTTTPEQPERGLNQTPKTNPDNESTPATSTGSESR